MCTASGVEFQEKKVTYSYMVHDEDGMPDFSWLKKNIDKKFTIKFDPDDMSMIHLFEETPNGLRHAAVATTKVEIHRGKQEQEAWEAEWIKKVENAKKSARVISHEATEEILKEHGMSNEDYGLNTPGIKGITNTKKQKANDSYGQYLKKVSTMDIEGEEDQPIYAMM